MQTTHGLGINCLSWRPPLLCAAPCGNPTVCLLLGLAGSITKSMKHEAGTTKMRLQAIRKVRVSERDWIGMAVAGCAPQRYDSNKVTRQSLPVMSWLLELLFLFALVNVPPSRVLVTTKVTPTACTFVFPTLLEPSPAAAVAAQPPPLGSGAWRTTGVGPQEAESRAARANRGVAASPQLAELGSLPGPSAPGLPGLDLATSASGLEHE